jgi:tetratricopeptide (TPR) repeat protein
MKFYPRVCFIVVFILLVLGHVNIEAQSHQDSGGFQFPAKAKADFYFAQGKFKEALELYKSVLEGETERGYIFRNMVKAWEAMEALDQAEIFLNGYLKSDEKSSAIWYALGYLQYIKNEDSKAIELFKQATELNPQNGLAWNNWAASLNNGKHFQEALEKVRIAIRSNPKELMFFFNLKKIFEQMGEEQRFEEEYERSLTKGIKPWGYGKVLARSLRQKAFSKYDNGDLPGAISNFKKMLKIYQQIDDVNGEIPALFSLGILYEESGNVQKGQEFFRRILSINPNHIQAREKIEPEN